MEITSYSEPVDKDGNPIGQTEATVEHVAEEQPKPSGNGKRSSISVQEKLAVQRAQIDLERERMNLQAEKDIAGRGSLFRVPKEYLLEVSRLTQAQIAAMAVCRCQEAVGNPELLLNSSIYEIYEETVLRGEFSLEGKSREENVLAMQIKADQESAKAGGMLEG